MMSERNRCYDPFGGKLVTVDPHIMFYAPKTEAGSLSFDGENSLPMFYSGYAHLSVIHIHIGSSY